MEKVLVTGADGFIGSHLVELLLAEGYGVRALSQYNSFNYWGWLEGLEHQRLEVVCGDVRDPNFCRHITHGCDTVLHLAALIAIPYSYVAPDSYVDTNIRGTLNMCQAARDEGVRRIVVTSTSEVYGTAQYVPIDENHPRQPQSPYSATKIGADAIAKSFYNAFGAVAYSQCFAGAGGNDDCGGAGVDCLSYGFTALCVGAFGVVNLIGKQHTGRAAHRDVRLNPFPDIEAFPRRHIVVGFIIADVKINNIAVLCFPV